MGSGLGGPPDDVANGNLLRNQPELVEPIGDCLLGGDDLVGHLPDYERRAVRRDHLDFERHAGYGSERSRDIGTMRLGPARGFRQTIDDVTRFLHIRSQNRGWRDKTNFLATS